MRKHEHKSEYESDFYKWTKIQASYLKRRELTNLDIENLIEEIETLGRSERRALESYFVVLLLHLLKTKYQPNKKTPSWRLSIENSRRKIAKRLKESPSLKRLLPQILEEAYEDAVIDAIAETGLDEKTFPEKCPWSLKEVMEQTDQ